MFEGTPNAPKGVFDRVIQAGGGINNGSTRPDYTNYIASAPVSALEPILWLEADRMKTLDFSPDQPREPARGGQGGGEGQRQEPPLRHLLLDRPGRPGVRQVGERPRRLRLVRRPQRRFARRRHRFHKTYYAPNNAVLSPSPATSSRRQVFALAEKYFGAIPKRPVPPPPDFSEPLNTAERTLTQETDEFARVPGLAVGWKAPLAGKPGLRPAAVLGELLVGGEASRFYQRFVKEEQTLLQVQGGLAWPIGRPAGQQRPDAAGRLRPLQAQRQRPLAGRRHGRGDRQDRRRQGQRRGAGAHQDQDALRLLRPGAVDLARQLPGPAPALHRRRRLDQRLSRSRSRR